MSIHAFGDSHVSYCFDRLEEVNPHYLGAVTMHRVGRDGADFVDGFSADFSPGDFLLFLFGEIDVRCHIGRISARENLPASLVIKDLADRYARQISAVAEKFPECRICLCAVMPPIGNRWAHTETYPVDGSLPERIEYTRKLNEALCRLCERKSWKFLNFGQLFATYSGSLNPRISDGHVHIAPYFSRHIGKFLTCRLGTSLTYNARRIVKPSAIQRRRHETLRMWMRWAGLRR